MPSFIIVEKTGTLKAHNAKTLDMADLYKKCGFKTSEGFSCVHTWTVDFNDIEYRLEIYGKIDGKANSENKYEFPPPIDNVLFFGNCAAVLYVSDKVANMGIEEFKDIMEHLYGGYSDIGGDEDDEDEDEDDDIENTLPKTKHGYVKDDFVVSSDAEDDDNFSDDEEEVPDSDDDVKSKKSKKKVEIVKKSADKPEKIKKPTKPKLRKKDEPVEIVYTECSEELTEEPYIE